jgi:G3E family GTPase
MKRLAEHQVKAADIIVLNKMDLIDDGQRLVNEWISKLSPTVRMVESYMGMSLWNCFST